MKPSFKDQPPRDENNAGLFIPLSFLFLRNNFNKILVTISRPVSVMYFLSLMTPGFLVHGPNGHLPLTTLMSFSNSGARKGYTFSGAVMSLTDKNIRVKLGSSI